MWAQYRSTQVDVDIVDLFWAPGNTFDPSDTVVRSGTATRVLYLHGGIHLWQDDQTGENGKWTHGQGRLLDIKARYGPSSDRRPLFVSEGTWAAKSRTIRKSSYLSFCLDELREDEHPTVVFGQALADQDRHIVAALNAGGQRRIAISMYPSGDAEAIMQEKARLLKALRGHHVEFFDSTTHPLGEPDLLIAP